VNCKHCGPPIVHRLVMGRTRRYCNKQCRNAAADKGKDLSEAEIERRFRAAKAEWNYQRRLAQQ
jgi:hypothetical protein